MKHMCCGFPLAPRGSMPSRCVCPPKVELMQKDFNCESGNKLLCGNKDVGGNIHMAIGTPSNMLGANYSFTKDAYRDNPHIRLQVRDYRHIIIHTYIHTPVLPSIPSNSQPCRHNPMHPYTLRRFPASMTRRTTCGNKAPVVRYGIVCAHSCGGHVTLFAATGGGRSD